MEKTTVMTTPTHMTLKQTAAAFGVTLNTLNGWIKGTPRKDKLPVKRKGRTVLVPIQQAQKWANKNDVGFARNIYIDVLVDPALAPVKPGPRQGTRTAAA